MSVAGVTIDQVSVTDENNLHVDYVSFFQLDNRLDGRAVAVVIAFVGIERGASFLIAVDFQVDTDSGAIRIYVTRTTRVGEKVGATQRCRENTRRRIHGLTDVDPT